MPAPDYRGPMRPFPGLETFGRTVRLPDGRAVFIYETGAADNPPLLLIHGLGDEADSWRHVLRPLAERYHVVALDLPGFGRSDPLPAYSLAGLGRTVLALCAALGFSHVSLLGSSLGAMTAQWAALEQPALVRALFLADGTLTARAQAINRFVLLMSLPLVGDRMYTGLRADPQAAYDSLRPYYANLEALPAAERDFLFQRVNERVWSDRQRGAFLGLLRNMVWVLPGQQRGLEARLAKLATPTLAVWGDQDHINALASAQALTQIQPSARLVVLPGAGHLPHQEQPGAFVEAILNFK